MSQQIPLYLKSEQRAELEQLLRSGNQPARTQTRARILLLTDRSSGLTRTDQEVADVVFCSKGTVGTIRRTFLQEGAQAALYEQPRPGAKPKVTGELEAQLTVLACSDPPQGHARWTLRLLADRLVELTPLESLRHVTVWERMKKTNASPGK